MSRSIAIVEDDADQRNNYADALSANGFDVRTYGNRIDAFAGMKMNLPDLAILDIMLEDEMDGGFDLCRDLRAIARVGVDRAFSQSHRFCNSPGTGSIFETYRRERPGQPPSTHIS